VEPRRVVGRYELVRLLGEGSMGRVFEARHLHLDRRVALKLLREDKAKDPGLVQRFFQEARTVNRVDHPHIVDIHDFVEDTDAQGQARAFCVMELLEGQTLAELVRNAAVGLERTLNIVDQVCRALGAAHAVGVIHRDLKPENVIVTRASDGRDFVKVLDFGVAKLVRPDPMVRLDATCEGALVGTPRYMAPEQAAGLPVDFRADVYGVGCLLYELLCGRAPFGGNDFGGVMARILTQPPEPLGRFTVSGEPLPPVLRKLVGDCLQKDPTRRPESMDAVRARLNEARCVVRPRRLKPELLAAVSAGAALGLVLLGLSSVDARAAHPSSPLAPVVQQEAPTPATPPHPPPVQDMEPVVAGPVEAEAQAKRVRRTSSSRSASRDAVLDPFQR
jgi:serine/threonine protein kinase